MQFTPRLVDNRTPDPNWNGNMALNSLQDAPVLSLVGETVATVSEVEFPICTRIIILSCIYCIDTVCTEL